VPITWCHIEVDESVLIQGHRLRFATVDLTASHADLRARLLRPASLDQHVSSLICPCCPGLQLRLPMDRGCGRAMAEVGVQDPA
jgi:hypothetical protein